MAVAEASGKQRLRWKAPIDSGMEQSNHVSSAKGRAFKELFCEAFRCSAARYTRRLFWHCVHRRSLAWAWPILMMNPEFFTVDFRLLDEVGRAVNGSEVQQAIDAYQDDCRMNRNFYHDRLRIRISGRRLMALYQSVSQSSRRANRR